MTTAVVEAVAIFIRTDRRTLTAIEPLDSNCASNEREDAVVNGSIALP